MNEDAETPKAPVAARTRPTPDLAGLSFPELLAQNPSDAELQEMFGVRTPAAARGLYVGALLALGEIGSHYRTFVLAMGAELEPRGAIEAMLVTQMGITHAAMMRSAGEATDSLNIAAHEAHHRILDRLARTFAGQVETLRRHRAGGTQTVRVEHVTVNAGGQAIVGNVGTRRGQREK